MDRVYGSWNHSWLLVHGRLTTIGQRSHSIAREVVVIAWKKREEVVGILTIDATWRQSYEDGHTTTLNRGSRWCSDGEMVPGTGRRDWSRVGCGG
jgi:hypothetical protein